MKKVEVYFLINLGAILSLFAIEGELAKYKRKQGDILLEVAKDKLETYTLLPQSCVFPGGAATPPDPPAKMPSARLSIMKKRPGEKQENSFL